MGGEERGGGCCFLCQCTFFVHGELPWILCAHGSRQRFWLFFHFYTHILKALSNYIQTAPPEIADSGLNTAPLPTIRGTKNGVQGCSHGLKGCPHGLKGYHNRVKGSPHGVKGCPHGVKGCPH